MRRFLTFAGAMTAIGVLAIPAQAAPITYTTTSVMSGVLGANSFTGALVTVMLTGDTEGVVELDPVALPGVLVNHGTATVTVGGVTATLNSPNGYAAIVFPPSFFGGGVFIAEFDNPAQTSFTGIMGVLDPSLAFYNLQTSLPAFPGLGLGIATNPDGSFVSYSTSLGAVTFIAGGNLTVVSASVAATPVPEPASLSLLGVGLAGAMAARRRQRPSRA